MNTEERIQLLKTIFLFSQLNNEELQTIAAITQEEIIPENTEFIEEGTEGNTLYVIVSGLARVYRLSEEGKEITVTLRQKGDVVGEMALIDNDKRSASVKTIQETRVLKITKQQFTELLLKHPNIAVELLKILSLRIRENVGHIYNISTQDVSSRTFHVLQTLAAHFPHNDIVLSHEELAEIIGATRPRITESLNQLQAEKKVLLSAKKIHVNE